MCYIVFISHSLYWHYIKIALQEYVIIDVIALNETFLSKKHNSKFQVMILSETTFQQAKEEELPF